MTESRIRRERMVRDHLEARGIQDPAVLEAMRTVPRECFVAPNLAAHAYDDSPLPIDDGQTISQPHIVGYMTEALRLSPDDRVLEVGTGSGYQTAILASIAREVFTVERFPDLSERARERLFELGLTNVKYRIANGSVGWPENAPYDAIVVTAAAPKVPQALCEQLALGGRLVIPQGGLVSQDLVRVIRRGEHDFHRDRLCGVCFVPLVGDEGWPE